MLRPREGKRGRIFVISSSVLQVAYNLTSNLAKITYYLSLDYVISWKDLEDFTRYGRDLGRL